MKEWKSGWEKGRKIGVGVVEIDSIFYREPYRKGESEAVSLVSEMWRRRELIGAT